ncbi:hypothetical protein V6N12_059084 [Hibiscus sabdariffa]|uniref:Stomatal closure-related actin-binding protein coiled-coil domain-containing protein n=1 Tax=Hibiscus sabdariffa TaxID=183260 RepID=A0ABR2EU46_9ROSI
MEKKEAGTGTPSLQDLEELMKAVQEARRIKMLHQASKVMDMEHELCALRIQLAEKSKHSLLLQKEVCLVIFLSVGSDNQFLSAIIVAIAEWIFIYSWLLRLFMRTNDRTRLVIATNSGIVFGVFIGVSFPSVSLNKIHLPSSLRSTFDVSISNDQDLKKLKGKNDDDDNGRNDRSGSIG